MKRILALMLALITLAGLAGCKKAESVTPENPVILKSEHYTITTAEFQYFLAKTYDNFASQYGDMITYMIDTSKPLRSQQCPVDQTGQQTWFDYVADGAVESVKTYLIIAETALAEGYTISDEDRKLIDDELKSIESDAIMAGYASTEEYIRDHYGSLCTMDSLRTCFELFFIANTYRSEQYESYTFTDEEYLAYANANPASCYYADFMYMRFVCEEGDDWEKLKKTALDFNNAVKGKDSFIQLAEDYLRSLHTIVATEEEADNDKKITEETLKALAKDAEVTGVAYATGEDNVNWIFAEGRLAGEQTLIVHEEERYCEVIYMLKPMYLSEQPTVDYREIRILTSKAGDVYKAEQKANELYLEWKNGEATEESFDLLAMHNTHDTTVYAAGGLHEDAVYGSLPTAMDDWCFDPARKSGDCEVIATDYGYHVMYFVSHGMPRWKGSADKALRENAVSAFIESNGKEYPVEIFLENVDKCPDLFGEE